MNHQKGFQCCAEYHLWRSGLSLAIYTKLSSLTWVKSRQEHSVYFSSIANLAEFFGVEREVASRAISEMVKNGWFEVVPRKDDAKTAHAMYVEKYRPKNLRPITHSQWKDAHGDSQCHKSLPMPWENEAQDKLAAELYRESQGRVFRYPEMMKSLRKGDADEAAILSAYHEYVESMETQPKRQRGWQSSAFRFIKQFRESQRAA